MGGRWSVVDPFVAGATPIPSPRPPLHSLLAPPSSLCTSCRCHRFHEHSLPATSFFPRVCVRVGSHADLVVVVERAVSTLLERVSTLHTQVHDRTTVIDAANGRVAALTAELASTKDAAAAQVCPRGWARVCWAGARGWARGWCWLLGHGRGVCGWLVVAGGPWPVLLSSNVRSSFMRAACCVLHGQAAEAQQRLAEAVEAHTAALALLGAAHGSTAEVGHLRKILLLVCACVRVCACARACMWVVIVACMCVGWMRVVRMGAPEPFRACVLVHRCGLAWRSWLSAWARLPPLCGR